MQSPQVGIVERVAWVFVLCWFHRMCLITRYNMKKCGKGASGVGLDAGFDA